MHFDAHATVPPRAVRECVDVEVGVELAIQADEQIAVEDGVHAERVVIGKQQVALRFQQVSDRSAGVVRPQSAANRAEKLGGPGGDRSCRCSIRGTTRASRRSLGVGAAPSSRLRRTPDASTTQTSGRRADHPHGEVERGRRHVDEVDGQRRRLRRTQRARAATELLSASRPELDESRAAHGKRRMIRARARRAAGSAPDDPIPRQTGRSLRRAPSPASSYKYATATAAAPCQVASAGRHGELSRTAPRRLISRLTGAGRWRP